MRKSYFWILSMLFTLFTGLSSHAASLTLKVNDTGKGIVKFDTMGQIHTLTENVNVVEVDDQTPMGTITVPAEYSMTAVNETTGYRDYYSDETSIYFYPNNIADGDVINITVTEKGGGGGEDPVEEYITFLFNPDGCAYVVTAHFDNGQWIEDEVYNTPNDNGEIIVPYQEGTYLVKPNAGFTLTKAMNEVETNPHYTGDLPNGEGIIQLASGSFKAGAQFIVFASMDGSFTVKGVGSNIESIVMMNTMNYSNVEVTSEPNTINFSGAVTYKIYSSSSNPLWKVEVTNDGETESLRGDYGNFYYTPTNGDEVVIKTDCPVTYAKLKLSLEGDDVNKNIINTITYGSGSNTEEKSVDDLLSAEGSTVIAGADLKITFNNEGFVNLNCKVNDSPLSLSTDHNTGKKMVSYNVYNDDESEPKEINIVVSARKEQNYNVTLVCDHPEAVTIRNSNSETFSFTTSPQDITVKESSSQISIKANSGWIVDGILVDGEAPSADDFAYGLYQVLNNCVITINVTNLAEKRTKTAVVYVDESVANPTHLSFQYADNSPVTIKPGYNFVKFCDEDRPFYFGYYAGGTPVFSVNNEIINGSTNPCSETLNFEDGGVIKYFNGTPTSNVVSYDLADDIKDVVEIYHDHTTKVDFSAATEYACYPGTMLHIKPVSEASQSRLRAAEAAAFEVAVNDEKLTPDEDGVYSYKVTDGPVAIKVAKQISTGVGSIEADNTVNSAVYNLQGIMIKDNASKDDIKALPAGVYVIGGKKVVVK